MKCLGENISFFTLIPDFLECIWSYLTTLPNVNFSISKHALKWKCVTEGTDITRIAQLVLTQILRSNRVTASFFFSVIYSNSHSNLEREKWSWRNQTPWHQTIVQSYSHQNSMFCTVQNSMYWHSNRNIDQWNRIANPEINLQAYD